MGCECLTQLEPEGHLIQAGIGPFTKCQSFVSPLGTVTEVTAPNQTVQGSTVKYDDLAVPSSHPYWEGDS